MPGYLTWFTLIVSNVMPVSQLNLFRILAPRKFPVKVQTVPSALSGISRQLKNGLNKLSPYTPHPLPRGERIKRFTVGVRFIEPAMAGDFNPLAFSRTSS